MSIQGKIWGGFIDLRALADIVADMAYFCCKCGYSDCESKNSLFRLRPRHRMVYRALRGAVGFLL